MGERSAPGSANMKRRSGFTQTSNSSLNNSRARLFSSRAQKPPNLFISAADFAACLELAEDLRFGEQHLAVGTWHFGRSNRDGSPSILTYPSGDQAQYTYSTAGRVPEVQWLGVLEGGPLAQNISYTPPGQVASYVNGAGVSIADTYNNRLQPSTLKATASGGDICSLTYNLNWGSGDNGNVSGITNNLNSARSQTFGYDSLNRLTSAGTSSTWGDSYGYDSWGNLLSKTATRGSGENWSNAVDANNHMVGWGYDGAGNLTSINGFVYNIFNAENQWTQQTT